MMNCRSALALDSAYLPGVCAFSDAQSPKGIEMLGHAAELVLQAFTSDGVLPVRACEANIACPIIRLTSPSQWNSLALQITYCLVNKLCPLLWGL